MTTEEVADYLVPKLKDKGLLVLRYDARTTSSIYLKLDYGVAGSLRIGDHTGFKNLHYTFNVECGRKENDILIDDGHLRYYYGDNKEALDQLVEDVMKLKHHQWKVMGGKGYAKSMNTNMERGLEQAYYKFWHRARLV